uniref:Integrase n=1 Tax=Ascaris lumbricoides TaxID=6252 RepID=A0A0M3IS32_ASCLU
MRQHEAIKCKKRALEHGIYAHDDSDSDPLVEDDLLAGLRNTYAFDDDQYFSAYSQKVGLFPSTYRTILMC